LYVVPSRLHGHKGWPHDRREVLYQGGNTQAELQRELREQSEIRKGQLQYMKQKLEFIKMGLKIIKDRTIITPFTGRYVIRSRSNQSINQIQLFSILLFMHPSGYHLELFYNRIMPSKRANYDQELRVVNKQM
jgi:hypothetical protein